MKTFKLCFQSFFAPFRFDALHPSQQFFHSCQDVSYSTKQRKKGLAQGHNIVLCESQTFNR